ncbi:hypothetical protein B1L04_01765 [Microcystis aeruginosa KW]|uniref:Uncharacterized protein n=1 Tax=Microcystis aeruginosa KW TaxID=1960155 RepID=A0A1V4BZI6_MICAE|nr:hypothetical protein B1L04_01765 [Microcystis aeruginosa KW]
MATPRGLFPSTHFLAKIFKYSATLVFFLMLSGVSYQLSVISYQLSVISYQLSVISYQLTENTQ